jgi:hypothetical protein
MNFEKMENREAPSPSPSELGNMFNSLDADDFIFELRRIAKSDPSAHLSIVADWAGVKKARAAKAIWDMHASRLHIDSFAIRATRAQHDEDPNAFQSGLAWVESE